ncbi:hypothetical protein [Mesorhizobium sp. LNJC384A00]|uniref:hypothetical protein n=1 Tax=Mesorhizobium sp. LNJC384A00 TaxID=1287268 RepID=UPI0012EC9094|nr:hypothetical protein [Mesorhizobium sp. LNJC384A00]
MTITNRTLAIAVHLMIAMNLLSSPARSSELKGASPDLGFTFAASGQNTWCDDVVRVDGVITSQAQFSDQKKRDKRLWRLLQIAQSRCDKIRRLEFRAFASGKLVFRADFPAMTAWKPVEKDVETGVPDCGATPPFDRCKIKASAYKLFERLTDSHFFGDVKLTSYMASEGPEIAWSSGIVNGTIIAIRPNGLPASSTAAFNAAVAQSAAISCVKEGGTVQEPDHDRKGDAAALASFICEKGSAQKPYSFITIDSDTHRWLLYVGSPTGNVQAVRNWTKYMLANE